MGLDNFSRCGHREDETAGRVIDMLSPTVIASSSTSCPRTQQLVREEGSAEAAPNPKPCPPAETNALNGPKACKRARNPPSPRHLGLNADEHRRHPPLGSFYQEPYTCPVLAGFAPPSHKVKITQSPEA